DAWLAWAPRSDRTPGWRRLRDRGRAVLCFAGSGNDRIVLVSACGVLPSQQGRVNRVVPSVRMPDRVRCGAPAASAAVAAAAAVTVALTVALLMTGCSTTPPPPIVSSSALQTSGPPPPNPAELIMGVDDMGAGFNPHTLADVGPVSLGIASMVLPSVFRPGFDDVLRMDGALAESARVTGSNPFTVTYRLRRD